MKHWVLASFNPSKAREIQALLPDGFTLSLLGNFLGAQEPEETGSTLEENAALKSNYAARLTHLPSLADDTGLMVEALGGAPGVYSARYAGLPSNSQANIQKLLQEMEGVSNRNAYFETVICLSGFSEGPIFLSGRLEGTIALTPTGTSGFGYDPVFIPTGSTRTLAEFSKEEKNEISHRGQAVRAFLKWLKEYGGE